ncbi:MAG: phosphotransferase [Pseudomonadota bacterium]
MPERFLQGAGWGRATRAHLAGDASHRSYERLTAEDGSRAVLMIAPPEMGEDVGPFVAIAEHLSAIGLSAPCILAEDRARGLLLIEDLGDHLYARIVGDRPDLESEIYEAAVDALVALQKSPAPHATPAYGVSPMIDRAKLALTWYAGLSDAAHPPAFASLLAGRLVPLEAGFTGLALRDYHAENLLWLPERIGVARVGLLDFQDAARCHPTYDLISLVEDARRDVPPDLGVTLINRFAAGIGMDQSEAKATARVIGIQRNLRILGVFARLCLRDGKANYVDLIPRVWGHLERGAEATGLTALLNMLPEPTADHLDHLRARCGTLQPA